MQIYEQKNEKNGNEYALEEAAIGQEFESIRRDDESKAIASDEHLNPRGRKNCGASPNVGDFAQGVRHVGDSNVQRGQELNEKDEIGERERVVDGERHVEHADVGFKVLAQARTHEYENHEQVA